jgi:hypothetical protein
MHHLAKNFAENISKKVTEDNLSEAFGHILSNTAVFT